jgi:hypothetical protein
LKRRKAQSRAREAEAELLAAPAAQSPASRGADDW